MKKSLKPNLESREVYHIHLKSDLNELETLTMLLCESCEFSFPPGGMMNHHERGSYC